MNTEGWIINIYGTNGGMIGTWKDDWFEVLNTIRIMYKPKIDYKVEVIKCKYEDRMSV